jgi:hypothetical protein
MNYIPINYTLYLFNLNFHQHPGIIVLNLRVKFQNMEYNDFLFAFAFLNKHFDFYYI